MQKLFYYGTDCYSLGHSFYAFSENNQTMSRIYARMKNGEYLLDGYAQPIDFNPEDASPQGQRVSLGAVDFFTTKKYTVLRIEGSPTDTRQGSKYVFFVKDIISRKEMVDIVTASHPAVKIIETCRKKFTVIL